MMNQSFLSVVLKAQKSIKRKMFRKRDRSLVFLLSETENNSRLNLIKMRKVGLYILKKCSKTCSITKNTLASQWACKP